MMPPQFLKSIKEITNFKKNKNAHTLKFEKHITDARYSVFDGHRVSETCLFSETRENMSFKDLKSFICVCVHFL